MEYAHYTMTQGNEIPRVTDAKKNAVLAAVRQIWKNTKSPCTFGQIAFVTGFSRSTAYNAVRELAKAGRLRYEPTVLKSVRPK